MACITRCFHLVPSVHLCTSLIFHSRLLFPALSTVITWLKRRLEELKTWPEPKMWTKRCTTSWPLPRLSTVLASGSQAVVSYIRLCWKIMPFLVYFWLVLTATHQMEVSAVWLHFSGKVHFHGTLGARGFIREEPWKGNKQSAKWRRERKRCLRKPLVARDS